MTKKDYIFIAETIKSVLVNCDGDRKTLEGLAQQFCGRFGALSEKFNHHKFMEACGLEDERHYYLCKRCGKEAIRGTREQTRDFVYSDICISCQLKETK